MLQAALLDCPFVDFLNSSDHGFVASEVDVDWCDVVQALVVAFVLVLIDGGPELAFEVTG